MAYCPSCDETQSDGRFCPECGSELVQPANQEDTADQPPPVSSVEQQPTQAQTVEGESTDYFAKGPLGFTFTYPIAKGWAPIIITGVFVFFSWLLIPYFLIYGYCYRLGRAAIRGDQEPPQYEDWVQLFVDGILLFLVTLPFVFALLLVGGIPMLIAIESGMWSLLILSVLFYLVGAFIGGGIVPTFMATGSVVETYRGFRFLEFVTTMSYIKSIVLIVVANIIAGLVLGGIAIALTITIIGILLLVPIYFISLPFFMFIPYLVFAYYYKEAVELETVPPMDEPDRIEAQF